MDLTRRFWTPTLLVASLAVGFLRMWLRIPPDAPLDSQLGGGAFAAGVLGSALLPWAAGALVAYGHWFWCKTRRDRAYMQQVYPARRRRVLHLGVLVVCLLMLSESLWLLAR